MPEGLTVLIGYSGNTWWERPQAFLKIYFFIFLFEKQSDREMERQRRIQKSSMHWFIPQNSHNGQG